MPIAEYFGCRICQRADAASPALFLFFGRAKTLRRWAGIHRAEDTPTGTQRILRPARVKAIRRFLEQNPINTIPTALLLAFRPNATQFSSLDEQLGPCLGGIEAHNDCEGQVQWGVLKFDYVADAPQQDRPALIVDGQHRIEGLLMAAQ